MYRALIFTAKDTETDALRAYLDGPIRQGMTSRHEVFTIWKAKDQSLSNVEIAHYESGRGQEIPETRRTMWSAFNAVTEYVDYHRPTRGISERQQADSRLKSAWFGAGARLKAEAWRQALHCSAN